MNSQRKISPSLLFTNTEAPQKDVVLITDNGGSILAIEPLEAHDPVSIEFLHGALVPGFINTHCHLELSHMKDKVNTGTGLVKFIEGVVKMRNADQEEIDDAIQLADQQMQDAGIVAVGDICNRADTIKVKDSSPLFYYSFVEMFDFWQDHLAAKFFADYREVYDQITPGNGHQRSAVPHAPYTVSPTLFGLLNKINQEKSTISIHNQETPDEDLMFEKKQGAFLPLFQNLGFSFDHFEANGQHSIHYALKHLDRQHRQLFVHNTLTTADDINGALRWNPNCFWASCPNANLYIENRLPDYKIFIDADAKVCLGTDSLTSNWQLSIYEEMRTIAKYQSYIDLETLVQWATINGAQALGIEDRFGRIMPGKKPGLNLIPLDPLGQINLHADFTKIA